MDRAVQMVTNVGENPVSSPILERQSRRKKGFQATIIEYSENKNKIGKVLNGLKCKGGRGGRINNGYYIIVSTNTIK